MKKITIAVDGPSASGKTTICKILAKKLNINHLSSGALYRAIALYMIQNNINENEIQNHLNEINIKVKFNNFIQNIYLNKIDVTNNLHTEEISLLSSLISQKIEVREFVKEIQRNLAKNQNIIIDGRDVTSVILPNSKYKFFVTASVDARAYRRYIQYNKTEKLEDIIKDIILRDERDKNRKICPLRKTEDSILIDSTNMSIEETVNTMLSYIEEYKETYLCFINFYILFVGFHLKFYCQLKK